MQIDVYDSNHQNEQVTLNVNVLSNDDFNDVTSGTFTHDGVNWRVTKTSSGQNTMIELFSHHTISGIDELNIIMEAAGLPGEYTAEDSVQEIYETAGTSYYRKDTVSGSYPYFTYQYSNNTYSIAMNRDSGDSYQTNTNLLGKITAFEAAGDLSYIGLIGVDASPYTSDPYTFIYLVRNSGITSTTYVEPSASPGDKGFKPIGYANKKNRGGGHKSGEKPGYSTDQLTQPGEPDESVASIAGTGFITVYDITRANLDNVGKALYGETLLTFLDNLFVNPLDFIISLNIFPYTPHIGSSAPVKLGRWECSNAVPNGLGIVANGFPLSKQFRQIDFGTLNVAEMFQSYLDYEASSFSLYLPFIGEIDIPVSEVMGGSINVKYTIDFFTGACVANVLCTKIINIDGINAVSQYAQHSYQGNCAIQIPVTHISYGNLVGSLINAAAAGLKGGVAGAAFSLAGDVAGGGFKPTVQTKGAITANGGYCAILYPYITVIRPITAEPENYQEVMGYPSYMDATLATCQGLCVCDDINLSGLTGATDSEISRIKQMCKEGIYI